jgi:transglutaminase/protease-like cytokinesis protein 3
VLQPPLCAPRKIALSAPDAQMVQQAYSEFAERSLHMHPMSRRQLLMVFAAGAALFAPLPAARAQENFYRPELTAKYLESSLRTDWYGVYLKDEKKQKDIKIGYVRNERKRSRSHIVEEQILSMKLLSFGKKTEISSNQTVTFDASAPHRMTSASLIEKSGSLEKRTTITWLPEQAVYESVHEVAGQKRTERLKDVDYTLADSSAAEVWVQKNPRVGDIIVTRQFEVSEQKMDVQTNKVLSSKKSLVGGVNVHFYEVESASKLREFKAINRYDDQGNTLSAVVFIFELRKETEEQAKDTQFSQDLFVLGLVKIDKGIGATNKVNELIVEVDGKETDVFADGPRQNVTVTDKGTRLIKLGKKHGKEQKATEAEIKEALAETNSYPITNPKIKELADKVTAGARTDEAKVAKIVAFVHDFVEPKLTANAPNIHDLLEKKQGDCKSYALLFNNLARAAGVPAREVSGLLYVGDEMKAFGGHAWNEVVLNGVWVPVDASMGETEVNATHVCFGTEHKATKNLLSSLGKLSFRLVEVKSAE